METINVLGIIGIFSGEYGDFIIALLGCLILLGTSGILVREVLNKVSKTKIDKMVDKKQMDTGTIVGKCENLLIFIFMILQAYTALGIIFAAKAIVRSEDMKGKKSLYFLAGIMVNVTYSIVLGLIVKVIIDFS